MLYSASNLLFFYIYASISTPVLVCPKVMDGITGIEDRLQDEVSDTIMKMTEALSALVCSDLLLWCFWSEDLRYSLFKGNIGFHLPICRLESSLHIQQSSAERSAAMVFHSCWQVIPSTNLFLRARQAWKSGCWQVTKLHLGSRSIR